MSKQNQGKHNREYAEGMHNTTENEENVLVSKLLPLYISQYM